MIEIERKFLVNTLEFIDQSHKSNKITQGYLNSHPERTVRIRLKDEQAFITIKGKSNESGTSRLEWEKQIDYTEANQLINLCEDYVISKTRYLVTSGEHTFEVDVFHGDNEGLILAEIELTSEDEQFSKPSWLGQEVTGDLRYYNSYIANNPYKNW
ncbi:CYTH domain-containing protein [Myroides marinus]|jgi:CYTH domain-containing protein|uniref:Adenylate cyclase n=1 Tax=Myroides marinus TaxID=703342 RepID=A0A164A3H2_9FLAO|nr:CYTH domain-containing protein [Myroides marinus]MDR0194605.1 CYTH domain-containing protein [Myroides sp.]KUF45277.1 adenylate cyclase [Myroides marinus]KZE82923.1 adenylate cyclase [Myroides marinus]MDM1351196.1 CYTH domain-containing protein [Myroides marinus]MDM1352901.1 CYTH domain-containing protein [Myroides marinus]